MIARCTNKDHPAYDRYGGRGIAVCDRWLNSFEAFLSDMGEPPIGHSIDRIDNDGDYEPGNCRWATDIEQNNNASKNRVVSWNGAPMTLAQLSKATGVSYVTLRWRLDAGWSVAAAVETPVRKKATRRPVASA
jgi:hypothetical protein